MQTTPIPTPIVTPIPTLDTAALWDNTYKWLSDPSMQGIGAVIGLIALAVALYALWQQSKKKELSYYIDSAVSLVSKTEKLPDGLVIRYKSEDVTSLDSVVVTLQNSGNAPITSSDFDKGHPIKIVFPGAKKVLDVRPDKTRPKALSPEVTTSADKAELQPLLLNRGSAITFACLIEGYADKVEFVPEIIDVTEIPKKRPLGWQRDELLGTVSSLAMFALILLYVVVIGGTVDFFARRVLGLSSDWLIFGIALVVIFGALKVAVVPMSNYIDRISACFRDE